MPMGLTVICIVAATADCMLSPCFFLIAVLALAVDHLAAGEVFAVQFEFHVVPVVDLMRDPLQCLAAFHGRGEQVRPCSPWAEQSEIAAFLGVVIALRRPWSLPARHADGRGVAGTVVTVSGGSVNDTFRVAPTATSTEVDCVTKCGEDAVMVYEPSGRCAGLEGNGRGCVSPWRWMLTCAPAGLSAMTSVPNVPSSATSAPVSGTSFPPTKFNWNVLGLYSSRRSAPYGAGSHFTDGIVPSGPTVPAALPSTRTCVPGIPPVRCSIEMVGTGGAETQPWLPRLCSPARVVRVPVGSLLWSPRRRTFRQAGWESQLSALRAGTYGSAIDGNVDIVLAGRDRQRPDGFLLAAIADTRSAREPWPAHKPPCDGRRLRR